MGRALPVIAGLIVLLLYLPNENLQASRRLLYDYVDFGFNPRTIVAFLVPLCLLAVFRASRFHPLGHFSGPLLSSISGLPYLISAIKGMRTMYVHDLHRRYGNIVRIAPNTLSIKGSSAISLIYGSAHCFEKSSAYDLHLIKGEGLFFFRTRKQHAPRRKVWNKALAPEALKDYYKHVVETTELLVDTMLQHSRQKGVVDLTRCLPQCAFDQTNLIFFSGKAYEPPLLETNDSLNLVYDAALFHYLFELSSHVQWLFHLVNALNVQGFTKFERLLKKIVQRRLSDRDVQKDVFSYWLGDEEGVPTGDLLLETETGIIAASDTVGSMLVLGFYFVLSHPHWYQAVQSEIDDAFGQEDYGNMTDSKLQNLPILNAVIQETLRLGAVFAGIHRDVPKGGAVIDGVFIPGGVTITAPVWSNNTNEEAFFPEPESFNPQRWLPGGLGPNSRLDPTSFISFSVGPFGCPGTKLAMMQLRVAFAMVLGRLDLQFEDQTCKDTFWKGVRNLRGTYFKQDLRVLVSPRIR